MKYLETCKLGLGSQAQLDNDMDTIDDRLNSGGNVQNNVLNDPLKVPRNRFWETVANLEI